MIYVELFHHNKTPCRHRRFTTVYLQFPVFTNTVKSRSDINDSDIYLYMFHLANPQTLGNKGLTSILLEAKNNDSQLQFPVLPARTSLSPASGCAP